MKNFYKNEETGRSMVEMLGVLAIIGVLSIGGISGYSKAMSKFRVNKTLDQISMLVMNVRSMYSANVDYTGLNAKIAIQMGIIPADMLDPATTKSNAEKVYNTYQGVVELAPVKDKPNQFTVLYTALPRDACVTIATADWGSQAGSGLIQLEVGAGGTDKEDTNATFKKFSVNELPLNLVEATIHCSNDEDSGNVIKWTYY